jgi:hypothetical protein
MVAKKHTAFPFQPIVTNTDTVIYGKGTQNGIENTKNITAPAE